MLDFSILKFEPGVYASKTGELRFPYRVKYAKEPNRPLLVFFHGGGATGTDNLRPLWEYRFGPYPELFPLLKRKSLFQRDFTVLIPQGPPGNYTLKEYVSAVKELCEIIAAKANTDKKRICCMGISRGGHCTWHSAYLYPDYYACAMPIMGALREGDTVPEKLTTENLSHMKDLPVWVSHSADDPVVFIVRDDETVAVLRALGAPVKYTRMDGKGHRHLVSCFFREEPWADWIFAQRKE